MILEHVSCDLCGSEKYRIRYKKPDNWLRKNIFQFPAWEKHMLGKVNLPAKAAQRLGSYIDRIIFSTHWEEKLEMSGIMVARYVKP